MTSYHWACCCADEGGPQGGPPAGSNPPDPGGADAFTPPDSGGDFYYRVWQEFVATDPAGVTYSHILESEVNDNTVTDGTSSCDASRSTRISGYEWKTLPTFVAEARGVGTDAFQGEFYGSIVVTNVGLTTSPVFPGGPFGTIRTKWWLVKAGT